MAKSDGTWWTPDRGSRNGASATPDAGPLADASVPVADCMERDVLYVREGMRADAVAAYLRGHDAAEAAVVDQMGRPTGLVTLADLQRQAGSPANDGAAQGDAAASASGQMPCVADAMGPVITTIPASAPVLQAAAVLADGQVQRLFVVGTDGVLTGCFTASHLARWVLSQARQSELSQPDEG